MGQRVRECRFKDWGQGAEMERERRFKDWEGRDSGGREGQIDRRQISGLGEGKLRENVGLGGGYYKTKWKDNCIIVGWVCSGKCEEKAGGYGVLKQACR